MHSSLPVIGIDPGLTGAATFLSDNELDIYDWEGPESAFLWLQEKVCLWGAEVIAIEHVWAMSYVKTDMKTGRTSRMSQKGSANFKFGENFGMWQMACVALGVSPVLVLPRTWQAGVVPRKKNKSDKPSFFVAKELFKDAPLKFKTKHHNRADALLIAKWAKDKYMK